MQQRQLRLGDVLDDYCPRERRLTNHAIVAMVGSEVRQTRCTTCDTEHEYKHARVPRQRPKAETAAIAAPPLPVAPKRMPSAAAAGGPDGSREDPPPPAAPPDEPALREPSLSAAAPIGEDLNGGDADAAADDEGERGADAGPVHRRLIRATLPRIEGQPPPARPPSDFTIRQPAGRGQRFRPRQQRLDQPFHGYRPNGGGNAPRGGQRPNTGRGMPGQRPSNRRGHGGRRPK